MGGEEELERIYRTNEERYWRGRRRSRGARPIGEIITEYMSSSGLARRWSARDIHEAWIEAAGEEAAGHSQVVGLKNGVLSVIVDSAPCLHEMANFRKREILNEVRSRKGCEQISDIEFRLGTLEQ